MDSHRTRSCFIRLYRASNNSEENYQNGVDDDEWIHIEQDPVLFDFTGQEGFQVPIGATVTPLEAFQLLFAK
ncbi:hypothetical protein QE152_g3532 [Popillia japonica]|uniref:Uncharacterized protein n=1 Tax=Popillia japonica TaxID=7064 RepID=A0AAW1N2K5_POPJA